MNRGIDLLNVLEVFSDQFNRRNLSRPDRLRHRGHALVEQNINLTVDTVFNLVL